MKPSDQSDRLFDPRRWFGALFAAVLLLSSAATADTLIPLGAVWRFLDNGTDPGAAWRNTNFNDSAWGAGPSELGWW